MFFGWQGAIESARWEPPAALESPLPFFDPAAATSAEAPSAAHGLRWGLTLGCGVGGFEVWRDTIWQDSMEAEKRSWEVSEPVRHHQLHHTRPCHNV